MKATYITNLMSSFYLWLDHEILTRGEAFTNYSGKLYSSPDPNFPTNSVYSAPFRQWVYDVSVPNANIPSGIFINGNRVNRGVSGLSIDFNKGRAIFNSGVNSNNITANYSFKEYNIYYTDEREEKLLFEKAYNITPKVTQVTGALGYLDTPYPCIFIKHRRGENIPFAFGGEDSTETMVRCIILASNSFSLDGVISILSDSARKVFPVLNPDDFPFNYFGDFKPGNNNFNYVTTCRNQSSNSLVYIDRVTVSKLDEIDNAKINKKCVAAIVDFELSDLRSPRVYDQQPAGTTPGLLSSVNVQNGGRSNLNGTFVYTTEFQGKPYYNKGGNANLFIAWFENQWNIFDFSENALDAIYWSPENVLYPWLVNTWYTINSAYLPVPSVDQII
jgi:hypothetical protein